ncbi:hypothetical protein MG3_05050 [Candida albicans P78048]|uniref:Uncharacterized protein n=1 Tax=Candida albicans P78048 TaxID=1094989 RepID=A0AB34PMI0_CANAX|nr:hypothetical protein MG3_05050 [Candida albicans P78048]
MSLFPTQWIAKSIPFLGQEKPCIYGFTYNSECYYYGLYLCNFENVWKQEVEKQKLVHIAKTIGIEDMSDDDLVELINDISRYIPEKMVFEQDDVNVRARTIGDIEWRFNLSRQNQEQTIEFLYKLNYQQFENICFMKFQVDSLKEIISVKDQYSRFLATNFKQSHGMDMINNYKKNNQSDIEFIERFSPKKWDKKVVSQYRNLQSKNNRSSINGLKICIETAINTISKFASLFSENEAKEEEQSSPVKLDPVEDSQLVKVSPSPSQSDAQSTQSANSNSMGSPIKRRISTYESLVPTSMSQASQSSQDTQSPRKRRKIGSLFKK